ncbi:MAG: phenylalanine--tRNA ligase subunit beta, partial [Proteobacteria bacterium]|nr:phenylalanine--tRNA ligase subunit beta [Pseudomonadota bacterium]
MKISLKWLNEFVDVQDYLKKPEALADLLTRAGLEVEEISNRAKDLDHVVSALILEKGKHPNADKLSLCQVTTGEGVVHQIVCGAQNHKQGDRVVLALPGAVLPGNFKIAQAQVRGVDSGGMLCSLKELGLAKESEGIVILPVDAPLGKPIAEVLGVDDVTFELKVTPNRADCLSHYGLAREVSCLLGRGLKPLIAKPALTAGQTSDQIQVDLRATDLCPRYTGRFISKVKVGPSPAWLKARLESVGLNSINNIVDVTNYVMMELGQPLHAFDVAQIQGKKIIVDRPVAGEKFMTLDGTELKLKGDELMIQDTEKSLCIGGVIGGKNSGVSEGTQTLFLEAAYFSPSSVRKSSRSHGLNTDSGYRFSRGVDPNNTLAA